MYCQVCGSTAPTKQVSFSQNVGVLVMRFSRTVQGNLCRQCIGATFWRMTLITFFCGWWGVISFFTTLFVLPSNVANYIGALSLPRTPPALPPNAKPPA